jgi:hypothetical protein
MALQRKRFFILLALCGAVLLISFLVLLKLSNTFIKGEIEKALGENVTAGELKVGWGSLDLSNLVFTRDGAQVGKVKNVEVRADFLSVLKKTVSVSQVTIDDPYFKVVIERDGKIVGPVAPPPAKPEKTAKRKETMPVEVKKILLTNGKIDLEDRKNRPPAVFHFESVRFEVSDVVYPPTDKWTEYDLSCEIPGRSTKGTFTAAGETVLATTDTRGKISLRNLDLALLNPYINKKGDPGVAKGALDMDMTVDIVKRRIRAPGTVTIRGLEFEQASGAKNTLMGLPRSMVLGFLKGAKDEIKFDFTLEGDLDNPQFNLREDLAKRLGLGLAEKLGLTVRDAGKSTATGGTKVLEGASKGIRDLFKRR